MKKFIKMLLTGFKPWDDAVIEGEEKEVDQATLDADEAEKALEEMGETGESMYGTEEEEMGAPPVTEEEKKEDPPETDEEKETRIAKEAENKAEQDRLTQEAADREAQETSDREAKEAKDRENQVSDDQVFDALINSKAGNFDSDEKNANIEKTAMGIINGMSSKQLLAIIDKAQTNQFGENSTDILTEAKSALVVASSRERIAGEETSKREKENDNFKQVVQENINKVVEEYPDLADEDTDFSKYMVTWREENVAKMDDKGNVIAQGPLYHLLQNSEWPKLIAKYAHESFLSSSAVSMKKELEQRRKKQTDETTSVASTTTSSDKGGKTGSKTQVDEEVDDIEKELSSMGNMQ